MIYIPVKLNILTLNPNRNLNQGFFVFGTDSEIRIMIMIRIMIKITKERPCLKSPQFPYWTDGIRH